ncbi:MAG: glycosyltransferase family 4 protein, partial [Desulfomonilia bacterium]
MKIGVAIEKFDPAMGGAERYCWDLAHYLSTKGHEVHVFCLKARNPRDPSIHILKLRAIRFPQALRHLSFALQHYLKAKTLKDALHFCVGNTFYMDIYQPHGGIHRAWFLKETQRFSERARPLMRFLKRLSVKDLVQRALEWWTLTQTRPRVIAISQMVRDDLKDFFQYPESLINLIPNGIDTVKFSPKNLRHRDEVRHRYGIEKDEFVFLFVAQNLSLKGFDTLVQACVIQKDLPFRVLIVGPSGRAHRRKARELEERVVFGGRASDLEK